MTLLERGGPSGEAALAPRPSVLRIDNRDAGISLPGLLQHGLGQDLEGGVGGRGPGDGVNAALALSLQKLVRVIPGVLVGIVPLVWSMVCI